MLMFGIIIVIWFLDQIFPKLLGVKLPANSEKP